MWTPKPQVEIRMMAGRQRRESSLRRNLTLYRKLEKNMEGILGYAARTIILRLVFAKAVPPILEVWGCSALGAKVLKKEKKKVVSVSPVNF